MVYNTLSKESLYGNGSVAWDEQARAYYNYIASDFFMESDTKDCNGLKIQEIFRDGYKEYKAKHYTIVKLLHIRNDYHLQGIFIRMMVCFSTIWV